MTLDKLWWRMRDRLDRYLDVAGEDTRSKNSDVRREFSCYSSGIEGWFATSSQQAKEILQIERSFAALAEYENCKAGRWLRPLLADRRVSQCRNAQAQLTSFGLIPPA